MKEETLGKGRGGVCEEKDFKVPSTALDEGSRGQVVSQGRVGRGGDEGSRGDLREMRQCQGW